MLLENEGPRPLFRKKLRKKREAWDGPPVAGRIRVWESPWGKAGFADRDSQQQLADAIKEHRIDVLVAGPLTRLGMDEAGTLQQVRDFMRLVQRVRELSGANVHVMLIHHENRGGQVSGAWEGAGDTLIHLQAQGHGKTRLYFQKCRWSSTWHKKALNLSWAPGESFEVEEREELDDNALADLILQFVRQHPGTGWSKVEEATKGKERQARNAVRDRLLAGGRLVNVVKDAGVETAIDRILERRPSRLFTADDPTIRHLLPAPGADAEQTAPATPGGGNLHLLRAPLPIGEHGVGADAPGDKNKVWP
jgi:hypothetical protein